MAGKVLAEDQLFESSEEKRKASLSSSFCNKISLLDFYTTQWQDCIL